jgi:hypothetical protein
MTELLTAFKEEFAFLNNMEEDFYVRAAKNSLVASGLRVPEIREYLLGLESK